MNGDSQIANQKERCSSVSEIFALPLVNSREQNISPKASYMNGSLVATLITPRTYTQTQYFPLNFKETRSLLENVWHLEYWCSPNCTTEKREQGGNARHSPHSTNLVVLYLPFWFLIYLYMHKKELQLKCEVTETKTQRMHILLARLLQIHQILRTKITFLSKGTGSTLFDSVPNTCFRTHLVKESSCRLDIQWKQLQHHRILWKLDGPNWG